MHIGTSKALSTNVLHASALELGAELAQEHGDVARAERWRTWAKDLRVAIGKKFWVADRASFAAFTPTFVDPAPSARQDLLATALAVDMDVADADQARAAIAAYPQLPKGPPVVWPPERGVAVYHNRAQWPFVTAYELRAARRVRNDRVATLAIESLVRGAALNLSNMENFEMITGRAQTADGPVVDSQRQLWSVAGYVAMVHEVMFGIEPTGRGLRFAPYITKAVRNTLLRGADSIVLERYPYRGRHVTVTVRLPPRGDDRAGAYGVGAVRVDGQRAPGADVPDAALGAELTLAPAIGAGLAHHVYRDGVRVATALAPDARSWTDRGVDLHARSACWSAETVDTRTGDVSHRSRPACLFGVRGERVQTIAASALETKDDRGGFETEVRAQLSGEHLVALLAANGSGPVNTGVTCGVKHVEIAHVPDGAIVGEGHVLVPHGRSWDDWRESSFVRARLVAGERYRIRVGDAPTAVNMSTLEHFAHYTGGAGGVAGAIDRFRVAELRLIAL